MLHGNNRRAMVPMMNVDRDDLVITSQYADDPEMAELIDGFIESLRETTGILRDDLVKNELTHLGRMAHQLKGAGAGYGFPLITQLAARVEVRVNAKLDAVGLERSVAELVQACEAAIRGRQFPSSTVAP